LEPAVYPGMSFHDEATADIGESQFVNTNEIARLRRRYSSSLKLRRNQLWRTVKPCNDNSMNFEVLISCNDLCCKKIVNSLIMSDIQKIY
jgi:hypothetical protein